MTASQIAMLKAHADQNGDRFMLAVSDSAYVGAMRRILRAPKPVLPKGFDHDDLFVVKRRAGSPYVVLPNCPNCSILNCGSKEETVGSLYVVLPNCLILDMELQEEGDVIATVWLLSDDKKSFIDVELSEDQHLAVHDAWTALLLRLAPTDRAQ